MDKVFSSWKEIAAYLGKGVRTVQRWEAELNLPVHRPSDQGIVLAYESELQRWAQRKTERLNPPNIPPPNAHNEHPSEIRRRSSNLCERASQQIEMLQVTLQRSRQLEQLIYTEHRGLRDGSGERKKSAEVATRAERLKQTVEPEIELKSTTTNAA